jgi:tetratricopeptide (TPR) repeat protein
MKLFLNKEGVKKADDGDFENALKCFSKAIDLSPKDSISYFNRASLRKYLGDTDGSIADLMSLKFSGLTKILVWAYSIALSLGITILFLYS